MSQAVWTWRWRATCSTADTSGPLRRGLQRGEVDEDHEEKDGILLDPIDPFSSAGVVGDRRCDDHDGTEEVLQRPA